MGTHNQVIRKFLMKKYGGLYRRVIEFDLDKCAYCCFPREALDHVPAISLLEGIDVREYLKKGGKLLLYPACRQCNQMLHNKAYASYLDRLDYLETKYLEKMDKVEVWTKGEINEMTGMMKAYIEANQYKVQIMIRKVEAIDENRLKHQYDDLV